jgi:hypothetical protein
MYKQFWYNPKKRTTDEDDFHNYFKPITPNTKNTSVLETIKKTNKKLNNTNNNRRRQYFNPC